MAQTGSAKAEQRGATLRGRRGAGTHRHREAAFSFLELRAPAAGGGRREPSISAAVEKMEHANARSFFRAPQGGPARPVLSFRQGEKKEWGVRRVFRLLTPSVMALAGEAPRHLPQGEGKVARGRLARANPHPSSVFRRRGGPDSPAGESSRNNDMGRIDTPARMWIRPKKKVQPYGCTFS